MTRQVIDEIAGAGKVVHQERVTHHRRSIAEFDGDLGFGAGEDRVSHGGCGET